MEVNLSKWKGEKIKRKLAEQCRVRNLHHVWNTSVNAIGRTFEEIHCETRTFKILHLKYLENFDLDCTTAPVMLEAGKSSLFCIVKI